MLKLGKEGYNGHFRICLMRIMPKNATVPSSPITSDLKTGRMWELERAPDFSFYFLETEPLLFRNTRDMTVDSLRDKKENCSTRRGLRVGTGFVSF